MRAVGVIMPPSIAEGLPSFSQALNFCCFEHSSPLITQAITELVNADTKRTARIAAKAPSPWNGELNIGWPLAVAASAGYAATHVWGQ